MLGFFLPVLLLNSLTQFTCSSADDDSFILKYNGGKIMTQPVTLALLWYGDGWPDSGREAIHNAIASLSSTDYPTESSDVPTLRNWWEIIMQYTDSSNTPVTNNVKLGPECLYTGSYLNVTLDQVTQIGRSLFNKTAIDGFGQNLTCTQVFDIDDNIIYYILFSDWIMFLDTDEQRDFTNNCSGDLDKLEIVEGVSVKMVWSRAPQNTDGQCSLVFQGKYFLGPPNGDHKIDSLVGYMLAKIAEEVTNRDGRGWSSSTGISSSSIGDDNEMSISGVCDDLMHRETDTPLFRDVEKNVSFNVLGVESYRYMVHYIWDQQIRNCALKLSEPCGADAISLTEPKGYLSTGVSVNHTGGLQPYPQNEKCQWKIQSPSAKFISFNLNYLNTTADDGLLKVCKWDSIPIDCYNIHSDNGNSDEQFKLKGSSVYVEFTSKGQVSTQSRGWELRYSAGLCDGREDIYDREGIIGYSPPTGFTHVEGLRCQWVLQGRPGTPVSLSFTHINITKDLDFLGVYNGTTQQMVSQVSNFSGLLIGSDLPQINLTGEVMVVFATQTDNGTGWSAKFYISSPIKRRKSPLLIAIIVSSALLIGSCLVFITLALLRHRQRLKNRINTNEKLKLLRVKIDKEENCIGEGTSAIVYRAVLSNGCTVAVKSQRETSSKTDIEEEILLKTSSQPNIISLLGYALDGIGKKLLVFEFMSRGTLSWNLRERGETLSWEKRLDIALQVSSSVQLLHIYSKPAIYHGNLRSENVLLDDSWNAKVGGFGSANYCMNDGLNVANRLEMAEDVLNLGLLLIELLRGEIPTNRSSSDNSVSLDEVNEILGDQKGLDPRLEIPLEENKIMGLEKLGEIAKWCTNGWRIEGGNSSPRISDVVLGLKQVKKLFRSNMS